MALALAIAPRRVLYQFLTLASPGSPAAPGAAPPMSAGPPAPNGAETSTRPADTSGLRESPSVFPDRDPVDAVSATSWGYRRLEISGAITRPAPIPMRTEATNSNAEVRRKMNPTPTPTSVVPPITHVLLSPSVATESSSACYRRVNSTMPDAAKLDSETVETLFLPST